MPAPDLKNGPKPRIEGKLASVGRDLSRVFAKVLDEVPGAPQRPQQLARTLGMNVVMTSRLLKATGSADPIAVTYSIPGPEPLRRLLKAARRKGVSQAVINEAAEVVDRFDQLIHQEAGDRGALDAMISGWLPDAREKVELLSKQAVFRGISQLLGNAADVELDAAIIHPSDDGPYLDLLWIQGMIGLRRVRPGIDVRFEAHHLNPTTPHSPALTLDGEPIENIAGLLLEDFCTSPLPQLGVQTIGNDTTFTLAGDEVGLKSAVDLVYAFVRRRAKAPFRRPDERRRKTGLLSGISIPVKALVFDMLLHPDVWPDMNPGVTVYRTAFSGIGDPNEPRREFDRIDVIENVQFLGQGTTMMRIAEVPRYPELIQQVCGKMNWDSESLRGWRCRIEFPIYSAMVAFGGDLPERPEND